MASNIGITLTYFDSEDSATKISDRPPSGSVLIAQAEVRILALSTCEYCKMLKSTEFL